MKKILLFMVLVGGLTLFAEAEQIVYYDSDRVLTQNKDLQEAQTTLENEIAAWDTEITELESEIQKLEDEYEEKRLILTKSGIQEALDKIQELRQQHQQKIQEIYGENGRIIQRNNELIQPIKNKLKTIIEKIAVENNYSLVLDAATGAIGYAKTKFDITDIIIEEMEKTYDSGEEEENK